MARLQNECRGIVINVDLPLETRQAFRGFGLVSASQALQVVIRKALR